jgi:hypothetical protein
MKLRAGSQQHRRACVGKSIAISQRIYLHYLLAKNPAHCSSVASEFRKDWRRNLASKTACDWSEICPELFPKECSNEHPSSK